jgi:hypothetical protein
MPSEVVKRFSMDMTYGISAPWSLGASVLLGRIIGSLTASRAGLTCETRGKPFGRRVPRGWDTQVTRIYEIRSGRQRVAVQDASSEQEALFDYMRSLGCRDDEIVRLGTRAASWRGAVYSVRRRPRATPDPPRRDA